VEASFILASIIFCLCHFFSREGSRILNVGGLLRLGIDGFGGYCEFVRYTNKVLLGFN
jgi:hypothetical protein